MIEVLVACLVLVVGLLGLFGALDVAAHTTTLNRQRQAETSLAREIIEDARSLAYSQLTQTALANTLQPMVSGSTLAGQGLDVSRSIAGGASVYNFTVSLSVANLTSPGDEKSLTVKVTPRAGTEPAVQLATIIYSRPAAGPAVTCLTTQLTAGQPACPGANVSYTTPGTSSVTFYLTTTIQAASIHWLVNGNPPPNSQIGQSSTDPFDPGGTTGQFTWVVPTSAGSTVDGTYTISAYAQDSSGTGGAPSSLQVTINEHPPLAPAAPTGSAIVTAGYNLMICASGGPSCPGGSVGGVDIQWLPSPDQDVVYYNVVRQVANTSTVVCSHVTGTSCTDLNPTNPGTLPSQCSDPPTDDTNQPAIYSVVPFDTSNDAPRAGSSYGSADADVCDHPPAAPTNLTATAANGALALTWTAPAAPVDPDLGDSIVGWRIYRWAGGSTMSDPDSRLAYIGTQNGTQSVTSFTDSAPDPTGASQTYCVTAVDSHLNESQCSNAVTG